MRATQIYEDGDEILVILGDDDIALGLAKADENFKNQGKRDYRQGLMSEKRSAGVWKLGMLGEIAVARALNIPWTGSLYDDVGEFQVKTVEERSRRLLLPAKGRHMDDAQIYISVVAGSMSSLSVWHVRGWAYAKEVRQPEYLDTCGDNGWRQKAYLLPNDMLHSMTTLNSKETRNNAIG
jgi:hypothetical protein